MKFNRILLPTLLMSLSAAVFAGDPDTGSEYTFYGPLSLSVHFKLKLSSGGQYTVYGTQNGLVVSGTMRQDKNGKYVLRGKIREPGGKDEGLPIDGYWDSKEDAVFIQRFGKQKFRGAGQQCGTRPINEGSEANTPLGTFSLVSVDVQKATGGDPKAWHYPEEVKSGGVVDATFTYPGLAIPTFHVQAPATISPKGGGALQISIKLNASGVGSADAHTNVWVAGLKIDQGDVLEVKVKNNESQDVSRTYNLTLIDPKSNEVKVTVGLTWDGPKYTFHYKRAK